MDWMRTLKPDAVIVDPFQVQVGYLRKVMFHNCSYALDHLYNMYVVNFQPEKYSSC